AWWLAAPRARAAPLPVDGRPAAPPDGSPAAPAGLRRSTRRIELVLDEAETAALLGWAPARYQARVDELLLAAFAGACRRWTGSPTLAVDLEGHGREAELLELVEAPRPAGAPPDLSRTAGWLTTIAPVLVDLPPAPMTADAAGPAAAAAAAAAVSAVARQLRAVPRRGAGYGLLRYLGPVATTARLASGPAPWVLFNYLGQLDAALPPGSRFAPALEATGDNVSPRNRRSHPLQVDAAIAGGRLRMTFAYSADLHRPETIERLAGWCRDELRRLLASRTAASPATPQASGPAAAPRATGLIAAPPRAAASAAAPAAPDAAAAAAATGVVEDVYDLTPMQHGILFHSRAAAAAADGELYVVQFHCTLLGPLDLAAFHGAWQHVVDRHAVLRTSFHWAGQERPQQVVQRGIRAPLALVDGSRVAAAERSALIGSLLAAERRRGFDLAVAPLLRVVLVRLVAGEHRLVFAFHHLLLDGWSMPLLFGELLRLYEGCRSGAPPALPPPRPFRDFVDWLQRQDPRRGDRFWRRELAGFRTPTPLPIEAWPGPPSAAPARYTRRRLLLSAAETAALQGLARRLRLTLGTLVHGTWALLLARHGGVADVLFGATSAGRPADLPGVEQMLGLFINTLPVRAAVDPEAPLGAWLARLQERLAALRELEHSSLADVQRASEVPGGTPLFSSLVIFENYPFLLAAPAGPEAAGPEAAGAGAGRLRIVDVQAVQNTSYPLALVAALRGDQLLLRLAYDAARTTTPPPARALAQVAALLCAMARNGASELPLG
ncbi:MAG: hypothetical protein JOZ15_17370, partial [Acidobacteria bacterium]|nr:hypothetical protein [Acidobacteriota bacterium]